MTLYDASLEQCVIGALCIEPSLIEKVIRFLKPDDFTINACNVLYAEMYDNYINNKVTDVNLLPQCLRPYMSDPAQYIRECMMLAPTTNNVVLHSHVIHDSAQERRLRESVMECLDNNEKNDIATSIIQKCQDYLQDRVSVSKTMFQLANDACDKLGAPMELRIDTGFPRLDGIVKGFWGGNLIIVGARPGAGKSSWALDLAEHTARMGKHVLFYSLEMLGDELIERLISKKARIPLDHMIDNCMSEEEINRYVMACADLSSLSITYEDQANVTVHDIKARARSLNDVSLIIIDYIGLLNATGKYPNRNLELGAISRELKKLATELRVPIVALAQLNRQKTDSEEPNLSDLRDSGELEQNASKVLFLWNIDEEEGIKGCKVAKNRRGKRGTVQFNFEGEYQTFTERSQDVEVHGKKKSSALFDDDEY